MARPGQGSCSLRWAGTSRRDTSPPQEGPTPQIAGQGIPWKKEETGIRAEWGASHGLLPPSSEQPLP